MGMIAYPQLGLRGRLGNALFEFASTVGVARTLGLEPIFPADWIHRRYFSIPGEMFSETCSGMTPMDFPVTHHIDPRARDYLQDVNLFWHCIDEIREYLKPSELAKELLNFKRTFGPLLGIHVRRGDNVYDAGVPNKFDYHLTMPVEYYQHERQFMSLGMRETLVVSDDIPWCKEHIPADIYGDGRPYWKEHEERFGIDEPFDWVDLFLLARCTNFIIGGSTFAVWGAILAESNHVVRPKKIHGPLIDYVDVNALYPAVWRVSDVA